MIALPTPQARVVTAALIGVCGLLQVSPATEKAEIGPGAFEELPLPVWTREEWNRRALEAAPPLLGGLVPGVGEGQTADSQGVTPMLTPRYADGPPKVLAESPLGSLREGLSLFLPEGLSPPKLDAAPTEAKAPTPIIHLREVTPEFLATAIDWPGDDPLIDPNSELAETPAEDLRRFLGYHAEEARIPILVLVLAGNEKLPVAAPLETLAGGSQLARRSATLIYPLGEPWRARLFLPRSVHEAVSPSYLTRMIEACLTAAAATTQAEGQLHEFVVQLSIRLFWLQEEILKHRPEVLAGVNEASAAQPLTEVASINETPAAPRAQPAQAATPALVLPAASIVTIAILMGVLLALATRRLIRGARKAAKDRRHRQVWTLPDLETDPRLGGAFCGGSGAWGSWK